MDERIHPGRPRRHRKRMKMNKTYLIAIAAALMAAPLALAHDPAGTPKNYCEPIADWNTHDYGPVASGSLIYGNEDGNLGGDCDNSGLNLNATIPCASVNPEDPFQSFLGFCETALPVADWDGHNEFAFGGAWILSGPETVDCFGADPHHATYGPVSVVDLVLGAGATFSVAADTVDATGGATGPCGDFESDNSSDCTGTCTVTFPPGLDGSYQVYVTGTLGHIVW